MYSDLVFSNNNIKNIVDNNYNNYELLFNKSKNYINGLEIYKKKYPIIDHKYECAYFHLITKEYAKNNECNCTNPFIKCEHPFSYNPLINDNKPREICPIRANATSCYDGFFCRDLKIWSKTISRGGRKKRICCLDQVNKYLMVLEERPNGDIYFVTGYPIEYTCRMNKLLNEYNKSKNKELYSTTSISL